MIALVATAYVWSQIVIAGQHPVQHLGINNRGQTVVTTDSGASGVYDHGRFTPLPAPPASCSCTVTGVAVNDSGTVVGIATPVGVGSEQGFVFKSGVYTFFSWAGFDNTEPRGIGSQGLVVGYAFNNDFVATAGFIYDPSTGLFTNVTPGSANPPIVEGINRLGRIAGSYVETNPRRVFGLIAQPAALSLFGGTEVPFASRMQLGGAGTRARGINDFGVVTGFFDRPDGSLGAFVGSESWGYEIVVPPGGDAAGTSSLCTGINDLGQIACSVNDAATLDVIALFIGTPKLGN